MRTNKKHSLRLLSYLPLWTFLFVYFVTCYVGALALLFGPTSFLAYFAYFSGARLPVLSSSVVVRVLLLLNLPIVALVAGFFLAHHLPTRPLRNGTTRFGSDSLPISIILYCASLLFALSSIFQGGALNHISSWLNYGAWVQSRDLLFNHLNFLQFVNIYIFLSISGAILFILLRRRSDWISRLLAVAVMITVLVVDLLVFQKKVFIVSFMLFSSSYILESLWAALSVGSWDFSRYRNYLLGALAATGLLYEALVILPVISTYSTPAPTGSSSPPIASAPTGSPSPPIASSQASPLGRLHSLRLLLDRFLVSIFSSVSHWSWAVTAGVVVTVSVFVAQLLWRRRGLAVLFRRLSTRRTIAYWVIGAVLTLAIAFVGIQASTPSGQTKLHQRNGMSSALSSATTFLSNKHNFAVFLYATLAPFTRTSAPAIMYAVVFPNLHPYYGLDVGQDLIGIGSMPNDNIVVWHALFPNTPNGAVAAPVQFVWYSQVGLLPSIALCFGLGFLMGYGWKRTVIDWETSSAVRSVLGAAWVLLALYIAIDSLRNSLIASYGILWALLFLLLYIAACRATVSGARLYRAFRSRWGDMFGSNTRP